MNALCKKSLVTLVLFLIVLSSQAEEMGIMNLGKVVNSPGQDYAPIISPDGLTLYFVSVRKGSRLTSDGKPSHDFWITKKKDKYSLETSEPLNLDSTSLNNKGINTSQNEGVASISADGKRMYFTACDRINGAGNCDIYVSSLSDLGWSQPILLDLTVNTEYWDAQPSISPDGKRLYFVSNRPGPNGDNNMDIWYSDYGQESDGWGTAINLRAINTVGRETSPFIAPDNATLFFSSDHYEPNLGGLDFYVTRYDADLKSWSKPAHLSTPLNTGDDDQFLCLPASGDVIYFSSKRSDIEGAQGDLDLYVAYTSSMFRAIVIRITVQDQVTGDKVPSTISIRNTATGRTFSDQTTQKHSDVDFVVTRNDFGNPKDSIPFVDLEITSKSPELGESKKILRVTNPSVENTGDFRNFTDKIALAVEVANPKTAQGKPMDTSDYSLLTANAKIVAFENSKEAKIDTLRIEEFASTSYKPLLNYVFFDENSGKIADRYEKLKVHQVEDFDFSIFHNKGILYTYSHILNIIGKRLKENPKARIVLTGTNCNKGNEQQNLNLSKERSNSIKSYLVDIWKIEESRIEIKSRNLPEKPSNNDTPEGMEENRRVEITSNDKTLFSTIIAKDTIVQSIPSVVRFKEPSKVRFGEAFWKIVINLNNQNIKEFIGEGNTNYDVDWVVQNEINYLKKNNLQLYIETTVNDKSVQKTIVDKNHLPVKFTSLMEKEKLNLKNKRFENFNLILFDFSSNSISQDNRDILNLVQQKIASNSIVKIVGYTDRLGNDQFNSKLSKSRATEASKIIKASNMSVDGLGESALLYDNDLPEGRFYCRTVDMLIETPGQGGE